LGQPHPPAGAAPASRPTALGRLCQAPVKLAHSGRLTARSLAGRSRPRGAASWPGLPGLDYARAHRPREARVVPRPRPLPGLPGFEGGRAARPSRSRGSPGPCLCAAMGDPPVLGRLPAAGLGQPGPPALGPGLAVLASEDPAAPPWPAERSCPRLRASRGSPAPAGAEADAGNARPSCTWMPTPEQHQRQPRPRWTGLAGSRQRPRTEKRHGSIVCNNLAVC
jgi:hypothetical protein